MWWMWVNGVYLQVVLGVPVWVEDNAGICCRQVDAQSSSSRTQQEDESIRVWSGKAVDGCLSQISTDSAIYSFIWISGTRVNSMKITPENETVQRIALSGYLPSLDEVVLQNVKAADHLTEDQDSVASSFQFGQQLVNENKFTSSLDHSLKSHLWHIHTVRLPELLRNLLFSSLKNKSKPCQCASQFNVHLSNRRR